MGLIKTGIYLAMLTALFMAAGFAIGGTGGMVIAFGLALAMNAFAYWNSGTMALKIYKARPLAPGELTWLQDGTRAMVERANMPMPSLHVIDSPQPNAFATGRSPEHGAVAVTTGLLNMLNREEALGVVAHELAHIQNRDTLTMTVAATIAGAIGMLANMAFFMGGNRNGGLLATLAIMILAPMAAGLVQMAISRTREYEADRTGAEICGNPLALASALAKISGGAARIDNQAAEQNPATAHMFIINPLHAHNHDRLFSTHPNTQNRIDALEQLARDMGQTVATHYEKPYKGPWG